MEKIEFLAGKLGVPVWRVKEALGMPLLESHAANFKQAECELIISKKDSEEERAALLKCIELASGPYEGQTAYLHAKTTEFRKKAFDAWDDLSLKEIEGIEVEKLGGFKKILIALDFSPENGRAEKRAIQRLNEFCSSPSLAKYVCSLTRDRSVEEEASLRNWENLSLRAVEAAGQDMEKLKAATTGSPDGGKAQKEGIRRMHNLLSRDISK